MHRRFLKLKVMAALFSAAFLLGAVDAGAVTNRGDVIINKIESIDSAESQEGFTVGTWSGGYYEASPKYMYYINDDLIAKTLTNNEGGGLAISGNLTAGDTNIAGGFIVGYTGIEKFSGVGLSGECATITGNLTANRITIEPVFPSLKNKSALKLTVSGTINADDIRTYSYENCLHDVWAKNINVTGSIGPAVVFDIKSFTFKFIGGLLGDVTAKNLIKAENLNATKINADFVDIASNLNISPLHRLSYDDNTEDTYRRYNGENILTIKGNSYLKGGAKLNSKSITGLAAGKVDASSTEAVNGAQLCEVKKRTGITGALVGGNISISSGNVISVDKTGSVAAGDSGILSGGTVYTTTNTVQTALNRVSTSVSKNQASVATLQDNMADLKKSVAGINSAVASTTKNLSSSFSNLLQADLGNLSDDGKSVIRNLITETLRGMNVSSASIVSSNEASLNNVSISPVSIMPSTVDAVETVNLNAASVASADIDNVYAALDDKAGIVDFKVLKAGVDSNATAIATNAEGIKANTSAIDALNTSKTNADGSNLDVGAYSAKLGTGKIEKDDTGLVNGGTVYSALDQKTDKSYVDAGLGMMSKQLDSVKQTATRDMNRMGANAAALTSLHPQNYDPADKLDFSAGYGHYHNSNATAVGAFYRPNASTMVSLAGTVGNGDSMVSAGLSFKLGMNANVEKVMISKDDFDKQQAVNHQMKGRLDNQTARLQQMEAALSTMISR